MSGFWFLIPLCRAEHRRGGRKKRADCLSPPQADEFPRAPAASPTRRIKRDMGGFFWFRFLDEFVKSPISALRVSFVIAA
jgi:hypothetical protein